MISRGLLRRTLVLLLVGSLLAGCSGAPAKPTPRLVPPTATPDPTTGTIMGAILQKNGQSLVQPLLETGIVVLFCLTDIPGAECLREETKDMDPAVLISSICYSYLTGKNCLLHWDRSAAKIRGDGSFTLNNVPPGKYDLVLIIKRSDIFLTVHLKNVEQVEAGKVTRHVFQTK